MARSFSIYQHFLDTGHWVKDENFSILFGREQIDLEISESIAIHQLLPGLNEKGSSTPLKILG